MQRPPRNTYCWGPFWVSSLPLHMVLAWLLVPPSYAPSPTPPTRATRDLSPDPIQHSPLPGHRAQFEAGPEFQAQAVTLISCNGFTDTKAAVCWSPPSTAFESQRCATLGYLEMDHSGNMCTRRIQQMLHIRAFSFGKSVVKHLPIYNWMVKRSSVSMKWQNWKALETLLLVLHGELSCSTKE